MGKNNFLSGLKDIGAQFLKHSNSYTNSGENTPRSLDVPDPNNPDQVVDFGLLGDYADKVDKTAQRSYVESGYISNIRPRFFETIMQEPDITIIVKKRMFSSLIENYDIRYMDSAERNFIRASKRLFQNKCQVISTYEKLTKVEKIITNKGSFDDYFTPILTSGIEALEGFGINIVDPKTKIILDKIRKLQSFSEPETFTTWFVNPDVPFDMGEGIGTFSLTTVATVNSSSSVRLGEGSCNLSIEDPYHLLNINQLDIDRAISDVFNPKQYSSLFQFSEQELAKQNNEFISRLNNLRMSRGVPNIKWNISENSILNKRVRAFIDESGFEFIFNYDPGLVGIGASIDLDSSAEEGVNGLNADEVKLFKTITKNFFLILSIRRQKEKELIDVVDESNEREIEYIRSKMRLQFANKNIIQVMDTIHVFISSKTEVDNKIIGVNSNSTVSLGNNILSLLNSNVQNLEQSFNNLTGFFGASGEQSQKTYVEIEKEAIVGASFPTWLWVAMRNEFTRQAAGTHTFAGVVSSASESYSNGSYTLSLTCNDNSVYFNMGEINVKPSVDVPDRSIFDPLTPFDLEFDASTGFLVNDHPKLLVENESLLLSGAVKFKNGSKFLGSKMTQFLYLIGADDSINAGANNQIQRLFFDPDGFVYRWKTGIGTFTYNGSRHPRNRFRQQVSPNLNKNAFDGQDVMNVLSLLVTGIPYNYNNFVKSAVRSANLSFNNNKKSGLENVDITRSFLRSLLSDLQIKNRTWGNFVPFKKLIMTENALEFMVSGQFSTQVDGAKINNLLRERAKLFDALVAAGGEYANNPNTSQLNANGEAVIAQSEVSSIDRNQDIKSLQQTALSQIQDLDVLITRQRDQLSQKISTVNTNDGSLQIIGDDISFSPEEEGFGNQVGEEEREKQRALLRRKMRYLTQRRLWSVKANEDQNLFIVDDQYDKNYDIQAFERSLSGQMQLFKSEYANVKSQIEATAQVLGLEVFANTQGHIEVRPPGYNKIPSSVFYRMVNDNRKLYPKTLETLFVNQAEGLISRLKIIEDEIRLRTLAFGLSSDSDAQKFLSGSNMEISNSTSFVFITDEYDGEFKGNVRALVAQDSPDKKESEEFKALKSTTTLIAGQIRLRELFDQKKQITAFYNDKIYLRPSNERVSSKYDVVKRRLELNKGQKVQSIDEILSNKNQSVNINGKTFVKPTRTQLDILKVTKELSTFVSERQNVLKSLRNAFRNLEQGVLLNNDPNTRRNVLFPNFQRKKELPSIIQHLIEDEEEDDLGPGSGGRFIIKDNQIINMSIQEKAPDFTTVEVVGVLGEGFVQPVQQGGLGYNGNLQTSAIAVDYDLWRMYGFKKGSTIPAPYITDADSQAAPLATWLLTEQRRKIISGSVTITGNEYMQIGEVVYIEDRDLLFYVENVSHNFTYGSNFTTTLTLTYGHNPGEYFPTKLDVVGQGLYSQRNQANKIRNVRHGNANGDEHLGVIVIDRSSISNTIESLTQGRYGEQNRATLTQILLILKGAEAPGSEDKANVEIRHYSNLEKGYAPDPQLEKAANNVIEWLKNPTQKSFGISNPGGDSLAFPASISKGINNLNSSQQTGANQQQQKGSEVPDVRNIQISNIDDLVSSRAVTLEDPIGPSSDAWLMARETSLGAIDTLGSDDDITNNNPIQAVGTRKSQNAGAKAANQSNAVKSRLQSQVTSEEKVLYKTVLDIWVTFKRREKVKEINSNISQAAEENNAEISNR